MRPNNPFTLLFGQLPPSYIDRSSQTNYIKDIFESANPLSRLFIITGIRGSGKTVTMTNLSLYFEKKKDWVVVDLNPESDLLEALASKLYDNAKVRHLFLDKSFSISFQGIGFSIDGKRPFTNVESVIEEMLKALAKQKKKVLITIDEVTGNQYMKVFAHAFQSLVRKNYDVFALMTGLHENVSSLQNIESLTFLYRAPKIVLDPLNLASTAHSYATLLKCDADESLKLAALTKGYAFAYQVLGSILWDAEKIEITDAILAEYDAKLFEYSYDKIWAELSPKDKAILKKMHNDTETVADLLASSKMKKNELSVYKDRLIKKGILDGNQKGVFALKLPRFYRFIEAKRLSEDF